jgi:hypothetical protein
MTTGQRRPSLSAVVKEMTASILAAIEAGESVGDAKRGAGGERDGVEGKTRPPSAARQLR